MAALVYGWCIHQPPYVVGAKVCPRISGLVCGLHGGRFSIAPECCGSSQRLDHALYSATPVTSRPVIGIARLPKLGFALDGFVYVGKVVLDKPLPPLAEFLLALRLVKSLVDFPLQELPIEEFDQGGAVSGGAVLGRPRGCGRP